PPRHPVWPTRKQGYPRTTRRSGLHCDVGISAPGRPMDGPALSDRRGGDRFPPAPVARRGRRRAIRLDPLGPRRRPGHGVSRGVALAVRPRYRAAMSLVGLAQETVAIAERGFYELPSGARVDIGEHVARAVQGTRLYRPGEFDALTMGPQG